MPPPTPARPGARRAVYHLACRSRRLGRQRPRSPAASSLYQRNASLLLHPASNMKLVTLAAAAERLGMGLPVRDDDPFDDGRVEPDGTLRGDLVVIGGGDPTIGRRFDGGRRWRTWPITVAARRPARRRPRHRRRIGIRWHLVRRRLAMGRPAIQLCRAGQRAHLQREHRRVRRRARAVSRRARADDADGRRGGSSRSSTEITTVASATARRLSIARTPDDPRMTIRGEVPLGYCALQAVLGRPRSAGLLRARVSPGARGSRHCGDWRCAIVGDRPARRSSTTSAGCRSGISRLRCARWR